MSRAFSGLGDAEAEILAVLRAGGSLWRPGRRGARRSFWLVPASGGGSRNVRAATVARMEAGGLIRHEDVPEGSTSRDERFVLAGAGR